MSVRRSSLPGPLRRHRLSLSLFEEPTSALDIRYQIGVMETMLRITREQNSSLVIAVHDLNLAYRYADAVLVLDHGRVAWFGEPHAVLTPECIRDVYGGTLLLSRTGTGSLLCRTGGRGRDAEWILHYGQWYRRGMLRSRIFP